MAGFAVDIGDEGTAYAQGVTAPSATSASVAAQGISTIGKGVFGILDKMDAAKRAAQPTESAISREATAQFSKALQATKGMTPLKKRVAISSAITDLNNAGFEIDEGLARMVKIQTGVDVDYLNFDPQQEAINSTVKKLQDNPAYLYNANNTLIASGIERPTQEQLLTQAMSDVQKNEAAALYLVNAKNVTRKEYYDTYLPQANLALENVRALALAGLAIETGGGNIKPENIVQLRSQFDVVKAQFTKPPLVSTEDWQAVQSQVDTLDQLLTTLETYDQKVLEATTAEILEPITKSLMLQAKELGKTDPVLAAALLSDKVDWSAYAASKYPEILKTLDSISAEDSVYTDLFAIPENIPSVSEQPYVSDLIHDLDELTKAESRTPQQRKDSVMFAAIERIGIMKPAMMQQPEHRENFLVGIGQATVNISTATQLFNQDTLSQVYNDDTYSKIALIRNLDPEKAELASRRLIDGLQAQANVRTSMASGTLASSIFEIVGVGQIDIKKDGVVLPKALTNGSVQFYADEFYDGNIFKMLKDYQKVDAKIKSDLRGQGFDLDAIGKQYSEVVKLNNDLQFYIKNLKKLGVDTTTIEKTVLMKQEEDGTTSPEQPAEEPTLNIISGDLSVEEQEAAYNRLPSGALFVDPADGKTYRKP